MEYLLMLGLLVNLFFLSRNILLILFKLEHRGVHKKRLRQLQFHAKSQDQALAELVDKITEPMMTYVLPKVRFSNLDQLEKDLKLIGWDKYFTPIQYRLLDIFLKGLGVIFFLILFPKSKFLAVLWGCALAFLMNLLFWNSVNETKNKIYSEFPDIIRIISGYLSANMPFAQAVAETIKYAGPQWQAILQTFVVESETSGVDTALENMKNAIDIFEIKEFVALARLTLEQGGDVKKSFLDQAEKITEMQRNLIAIKIGKRKTMGIFLQFPLLVCNILIFSLPTIDAMLNLNTL